MTTMENYESQNLLNNIHACRILKSSKFNDEENSIVTYIHRTKILPPALYPTDQCKDRGTLNIRQLFRPVTSLGHQGARQVF